MADDFAKLSLQQSLASAATARALAEIERTGRALPCSVIALNPNDLGYSFVQVKFEVAGTLLPPLILPKAESQYLRAPTQVGDFGFTAPLDTYTGGINGFGGVADLSVDYGNLSSLVWVPCGSSAFAASPDHQKAWINGPAGAIVSDAQQTASVTVSASQVLAAVMNGASVTVTANETVIAVGGGFGLSVTFAPSALTISVGGKTWMFAAGGFTDDMGVVLDSHIHGGVQSGSSVTGPPEA